eukprot:10358571-Alexandrium_andersonii.AAC.1
MCRVSVPHRGDGIKSVFPPGQGYVLSWCVVRRACPVVRMRAFARWRSQHMCVLSLDGIRSRRAAN